MAPVWSPGCGGRLPARSHGSACCSCAPKALRARHTYLGASGRRGDEQPVLVPSRCRGDDAVVPEVRDDLFADAIAYTTRGEMATHEALTLALIESLTYPPS